MSSESIRIPSATLWHALGPCTNRRRNDSSLERERRSLFAPTAFRGHNFREQTYIWASLDLSFPGIPILSGWNHFLQNWIPRLKVFNLDNILNPYLKRIVTIFRVMPLPRQFGYLRKAQVKTSTKIAQPS